MTRSIGRQQRAAARAQAKAEGRLTVIDGGKTAPKPPMLVSLTILVPEAAAKAIEGLFELVKNHYPHRNDFLEDLLKEGLRSALDAQREAVEELRKRQIEAEAERDQALVQLVPTMPRELSDYVGKRTEPR